MRKIIIELQVEWDDYEDVADELIVEDAITAKVEGVGWRLLQQTHCSTLLEDLEQKLKAVRMLTFAMDEVTAARYDATESTLLSVIELIKERQPIA